MGTRHTGDMLIQAETLYDIADAVRAKNGSTDEYTLDQIPEAISAITAADKIAHADIPDYVKEEALEVAKKVQAVRQDDSIVFLAMSDSHYYGEQGSAGVDSYVDSNGTQGNTSNLHSAMGAKVLAYALDLDFIAHLGDMTWGYKTTTSDLLHSQVNELFGYLNESYEGLPKFCCVGNHDSGIYYHDAQIAAGNSGTFTESAEWIYNNFTKHSESDDTVIAGEDCGGYCYRDFADKKLRVFMLNTSEALIKDSLDNCTYGSQRIWFGNALLDLNTKSDATEWSWLLLCHYPADYGGTMPLSELLKAYVEGSSISITNEKTSTATTLNFSGNNGAKMIAQFHGHVHNFKVSKLNSYATGSAVQYDAWRVCIPNAQYNRENYYSTVGSRTDIDFSEELSYTKTKDTGDDTSFVINVINPSEQVIHSICYGAGYDRTIGYGATVYYGITIDIPNGTIDNEATSIAEGETYSAIFTAKVDYEVESLSGTAGSVKLSTANFYRISDGDNGEHRWRISIPDVSGNIYITGVVTKPLNYTNQVPISIDSTGAVYNDGLGYKDGYTLTSEGGEATGGRFTLTGFIPAKQGVTVRIGGSAFADYTEYGTRMAAYDADFNFLGQRNGSQWDAICTVTSEDNTSFTGIPNQYFITSSTAYIRISCRTGSHTGLENGADLIITIDEPID